MDCRIKFGNDGFTFQVGLKDVSHLRRQVSSLKHGFSCRNRARGFVESKRCFELGTCLCRCDGCDSTLMESFIGAGLMPARTLSFAGVDDNNAVYSSSSAQACFKAA